MPPALPKLSKCHDELTRSQRWFSQQNWVEAGQSIKKMAPYDGTSKKLKINEAMQGFLSVFLEVERSLSNLQLALALKGQACER